MRHLLYLFGIVAACICCYTLKPVEAQAQKSMSYRGSIGTTSNMNMLKNLAPAKNGSLVSVDSAYFQNNQWYSAIFKYNQTETRPANSSRIYVEVTGRTGAWNVYKFGISWVDVFELPGILTAIQTRNTNDSLALITERNRAIAAEANLQPKGTYVTTETDPLYSANGVPKTRTITAGAGFIGGGDLSANRTLLPDTNVLATKALTNTLATKASLAAYVKGVQLGGGSNTFTISSLLAGATVNVTVPLNTTFADNNYQVTQPTVIISGGISVLSSLTVMPLTKNTTNVVVQIRNNALLAAAVSGTVEVVALKVTQ